MNHEPECTDILNNVNSTDASCAICTAIQSAYQRGIKYGRQMTALDHLADYSNSVEQLEAAYQRGKEDAMRSCCPEIAQAEVKTIRAIGEMDNA